MKVLFVDDERQILRGIERMLDASDIEWEAEFVGSGQEALDRIKQDDEIDTLVTDMRMPGMDGAQLLEQVSIEYPHIVRIILSGQADKSTVLRAVTPMHQYLSKPCQADVLKSTVSRAVAMRNVLRSKSLEELIGSFSSLPSLPSTYQKLMKELQSEDSSLETIGEVISQDPGMTAKILQLSNSAVFGLRQEVSSASRAVSLLGIETIKSLTLSVGVFKEFESSKAIGFSVDALMRHCLEVAMASKKIASSADLSVDQINEAFTAGILHDVGKLILASADPDLFKSAQQKASNENIPDWQAERELFGADHSAVGAHLLSMWGLPQSIVEIVALHHTPEEITFSPLTAVVVANELNQNEGSNGREQRFQDINNYLSSLGCVERFAEWENLIHSDQ